MRPPVSGCPIARNLEKNEPFRVTELIEITPHWRKEESDLSTKSEILGWINSAKAKVNKYRTTTDNNNKKIDRLKKAYDELGDIKGRYQTARHAVNEMMETERFWHGDKRKKFLSDGVSLDGEFGAYYNTLDAAQDAVNTKIGELRAENSELIPIIGKLLGNINRWWAEYQNADN